MKPFQVDYRAIWARAIEDQEETARKGRNDEHWESVACRLGFGPYKAQCFCERLALEYSSPWIQLTAVEAGRLYLLNKHHWHPEQVRKLEILDLLLLLHVELVEMKLTEKEWLPVFHWTQHMDCHEDLAKSARVD